VQRIYARFQTTPGFPACQQQPDRYGSRRICSVKHTTRKSTLRCWRTVSFDLRRRGRAETTATQESRFYQEDGAFVSYQGEPQQEAKTSYRETWSSLPKNRTASYAFPAQGACCQSIDCTSARIRARPDSVQAPFTDFFSKQRQNDTTVTRL